MTPPQCLARGQAASTVPYHGQSLELRLIDPLTEEEVAYATSTLVGRCLRPLYPSVRSSRHMRHLSAARVRFTCGILASRRRSSRLGGRYGLLVSRGRGRQSVPGFFS